MREILFRGKKKKDGHWVQGGFFVCRNFKDEDEYNISNNGYLNDVIPETIGQYTGLTDKNGKKIFEGDILKYTNEDNEVRYIKVIFDDCAFLVEDGGIVDCDLLPSYVCLGIEVAGNIHDNPELLKSEVSTI